MRKFQTILLICSVLFLFSCSKEDVEYPDILKEKQYISSTLQVYYCGEEMPGKSVTLIPSQTGDPLSVVLRCEGSTDLSQLSSIGLSGTGAAPGVLPGSSSLELPVRLSKDKDGYSFSGSSSTEYCSFSYSGSITDKLLSLNITDVQLSDKSFAGSIWKPTPLKQSGIEVDSNPIYTIWEIDPVPELDIDLSRILELLTVAPIIPTYHNTAYSSISQLISSSLQTIAFLENGDIIVRYFSSVGGATQLVTSQGPTLQYLPLAPNLIKLYPNPTSLFGLWLVAQSDSSDIPDISFKAKQEGETLKESLLPIVKELVPGVLQMTMAGIPVHISKTETGCNAYLGTETILTVLDMIAKAVAQNPEIIDVLMGEAPQTPEMAELISKLPQILPQLQTILANTTRIEIGLSLEPYQ